VIVVYIDGHKARFGVEPICRVLSEHGMKIAPSTYYAALKARVSAADLADAYLVNALVTLFRKNRRVYGVRKCWHEMRRAGHHVGRDQVARLMRIAGIEGVVRGKQTTTTTRPGEQSAPRHPDLIDRAWDTPTGPDQWWVADFTYVWTLAGFCYVALLTDVYSRRILGWRVTTSKTTALVMSVLEQGAQQVRAGGGKPVHHELPLAPGGDQCGGPQRPEVVRDKVRGEPAHPREVTHAQLTTGGQSQRHPQPGGVGQGLRPIRGRACGLDVGKHGADRFGVRQVHA